MPKLPHITRCGLPGVDRVPFGMHACHFYRDRQNLVAPEDWPAFMAQERAMTARFSDRRSDALCSYALARCNDRQRGHVVDANPHPLERADADWQLAAIRRLLGTRHFVEIKGGKK